MRLRDFPRLVVFAATLAGGARGADALERARVQDIVVECAQCHGADGVSNREGVPNLGGQNAGYLLRQLTLFRSGKRVHRSMRFMSRSLTTPELRAIADYYSGIPEGSRR